MEQIRSLLPELLAVSPSAPQDSRLEVSAMEAACDGAQVLLVITERSGGQEVLADRHA